MSTDDLGDRGQNMFFLLLTDYCGRSEPIFRPRFLGDKYPTHDYIVELVDRPEYFFFVQVKSTTRGYTLGQPSKLLVQVTQQDVNRMVACPAPTYVAGIDLRNGSGYLLSVNESREQVASLITDHKIDCNALRMLANEVIDFWNSRDMVLRNSHFSE